MRTRNRMTPLVAAAMIGLPIAVGGPASAHADAYSSESLSAAGETNLERISPAPMTTDLDSLFPAEATAPAARQERLPVQDPLLGNDAEVADTHSRLTEPIALLALGLLCVGAGIVTVTAEKRRALTTSE